jgi:hypothetical protein
MFVNFNFIHYSSFELKYMLKDKYIAGKSVKH